MTRFEGMAGENKKSEKGPDYDTASGGCAFACHFTPVGDTATAREKETEAVTEDPFGVAELENRLKRILAQVDGIGRTEVMLTLKSGGKNIVEKDLEQSRGEEVGGNEGNSGNSSEIKSNESTVYQKDSYGNETPYIMEKLAPEIDGVLVIAQGTGNASITSEITEAVMALFNVPAHKIKVMKMK